MLKIWARKQCESNTEVVRKHHGSADAFSVRLREYEVTRKQHGSAGAFSVRLREYEMTRKQHGSCRSEFTCRRHALSRLVVIAWSLE